MKIAIVDDNAAMCKVLAALFAKQGHQVVACLADGTGIDDCLRDQAPEVICLDYLLPGEDGLTLLGRIHQQSADVDVLFMTASDDPALEGRAADAGAAGFLHKPFAQAEILDRLRQIAEARQLVAKAIRRPEEAAAGDGRRTALIVDDSGSIRLLLKGILQELGMRVLQTVADGQEGIEAARRLQPDLVCLDVDMPHMGGLEALPRIVEASPASRVVMVTGHADRALVEAAAAAGAKGYILKPLRPAYVQAFMKKLFG